MVMRGGKGEAGGGERSWLRQIGFITKNIAWHSVLASIKGECTMIVRMQSATFSVTSLLIVNLRYAHDRLIPR